MKIAVGIAVALLAAWDGYLLIRAMKLQNEEYDDQEPLPENYREEREAEINACFDSAIMIAFAGTILFLAWLSL